MSHNGSWGGNLSTKHIVRSLTRLSTAKLTDKIALICQRLVILSKQPIWPSTIFLVSSYLAAFDKKNIKLRKIAVNLNCNYALWRVFIIQLICSKKFIANNCDFPEISTQIPEFRENFSSRRSCKNDCACALIIVYVRIRCIRQLGW